MREELVDSIQYLLWPEMDLSAIRGPEDGNYYALTPAQIADMISFWRARREPFPYLSDAWDCDDKAREFHHLAHVWSIRLTGGAPIAPAVGSAYVRLNGDYPYFSVPVPAYGVYHVLNVFLRTDGQWFFFEPQTGNSGPIEGPLYEGIIEIKKVQI